MKQDMCRWRSAGVRTIGWLLTLSCCLSGCGRGDAEGAAQSARLVALEQEVRRLSDNVAALKVAAPSHAQPAQSAAASGPEKAFKLSCPQPWLRHTPLGATLWICHAPTPAAEGMYPHCSVTWQPQLGIETKGYFEFALNAGPQLLDVKNIKDTPVKHKGAEAFEATFEADPKPVPLKILSVLHPHNENTFAITCFAPRATFDKYEKAFRQIADTFQFTY